MLSFEEAKEIGIRKCVELLGEELVDSHADTTSTAYGEHEENKVFCFVGVGEDQEYEKGVITLTHDGFPYQASCLVSRVDGSIEVLETVLPDPR